MLRYVHPLGLFPRSGGVSGMALLGATSCSFEHGAGVRVAARLCSAFADGRQREWWRRPVRLDAQSNSETRHSPQECTVLTGYYADSS